MVYSGWGITCNNFYTFRHQRISKILPVKRQCNGQDRVVGGGAQGQCLNFGETENEFFAPSKSLILILYILLEYFMNFEPDRKSFFQEGNIFPIYLKTILKKRDHMKIYNSSVDFRTIKNSFFFLSFLDKIYFILIIC